MFLRVVLLSLVIAGPVAGAGVPQPPTALRLVARSGQTVTLGWTAPIAGPAVVGYVIEGGLAPGEVLGSVPTTGTGTVFTFDAPLGAFLVRVHAIGESGRSLASNEIPLVVSGALGLALAAAFWPERRR